MLAGREKLSNQCARLLRAYAPARYVDPIIRQEGGQARACVSSHHGHQGGGPNNHANQGGVVRLDEEHPQCAQCATASVLYTLLKEDVTARLKPQKPEPDESAEA